MSHIGQLFKTARWEASLTRKEVVLAAGYRNLNKGLRRLNMLEDGWTLLPNPRIVERFAMALSIDEADIAEASALDWDELNRPIRRPAMVTRIKRIQDDRGNWRAFLRGDASRIIASDSDWDDVGVDVSITSR